MEIRDIIPFVVSALMLVAIVAAVGAVVYIVLRLRSGEPMVFPTRLMFRIYLYLITLVSLVTLLTGISDLAQAGLGAALGKEFSYNPSFVAAPRPLPDGTEPEDFEKRLAESEAGLERAMKEGLLDGISLTIVGALVLGLHVWGRTRLETVEERQDILHRIYLIVMLAIFGVVTLVALPTATFETLRFYILEADQSRGTRPGGPLATAIVTLPVWVYYLGGTIGLLRRQQA